MANKNTDKKTVIGLIAVSCLLVVAVLALGSALHLNGGQKPVTPAEQPTTMASQHTTSSSAATTVSTATEKKTTSTTASSATTSTTKKTTTSKKVTTTEDDGAEKLAALSFDDGPGKYTEQLVDYFKTKDIHATFFMVGKNMTEKYTPLIKRMMEEGHDVAGHSYSHQKLTTVSDAVLKTEVDNNLQIIKKITGAVPTLFRVPYGAYNDKVKNYAKERDLRLIQWSVDSNDWRYSKYDFATAKKNVMYQVFDGENHVKNGAIILMHDIHENSVKMVPYIVEKLESMGYKLVSVSELLNARANGGVAGEVYKRVKP